MKPTTHHIECSVCTNTECLIKKYCSEEVAQSFIQKKNVVNCKKTQNILIEGAPIHGLYFVFSGVVKVFNTGIFGREQILRFSRGGEMVGQRGFATHQYYPVGAVAIEDTVLCHFSSKDMKEMLLAVPKLAYNFMIFYAEELNRTEEKVRKFAHMTVREKVIDSFLYINRKFGQTNGLLELELSRKDIADFSGTTEEQVIRVISALKKEGLMISEGKKLGITNIDALKKEINEHHYFIQS